MNHRIEASLIASHHYLVRYVAVLRFLWRIPCADALQEATDHTIGIIHF